ncbi:MAG: hypothetical protein LM567_03595 [Desulfurococcaceae archaeon]|nr:hypothetical protein [Desulfurococcaceae archaeon]
MDNYTEVFLLALLILLVLYMIYESYIKKRREKESTYVTREALICLNCRYVIEKDFEPGDFIGLIKDTCPRCGGKMKIKGIYGVEVRI